MKQTKLFCDVCGKEFPPKEYCFITGQIIKVNAELRPELIGFEGHFCEEETKKIQEFIAGLANEKNAQHSNPPRVGKESIKK